MSVESARVIWSEGLFLRPHHFPQQERFLEGLVDSRLQQLVHSGVGFSRLVIDQALLLQGKLHLTAATGVMPDGTPFELPSDAAHLVAFDVPEGTRDATVHLAAMLRRGGAKSFTLEAAGQAPRRVAAVHQEPTVDQGDLEVGGMQVAQQGLGRVKSTQLA
jgi:type VI secretion system protein ImpJ